MTLRTVATRYILQQKCPKKWIGSAPPQEHTFQPPTPIWDFGHFQCTMQKNAYIMLMWHTRRSHIFCLYIIFSPQNFQYRTINYLGNSWASCLQMKRSHHICFQVYKETSHDKNYYYFWLLFKQPVFLKLAKVRQVSKKQTGNHWSKKFDRANVLPVAQQSCSCLAMDSG